MPITTRNANLQYQFDWTKWPVPTMPDIPVDFWDGVAGCFWKEPIKDRAVDQARTLKLKTVDVPIGTSGGNIPWQGSTYGAPYQLINSKGPTTAVWDASRPITWNWFTPTLPIVHVPLPNVVAREGDPNGSSDLHWYGYDPTNKVLWEAILLLDNGRWNSWFQCDWTAGYMGGGPGLARWDCSKPWDAPGQPRGVVAGAIPQLPLVARWDEIRKGRINHALFGVLPNYAPEKTGPARGTDGQIVGHPVRAGERLRLKRSVVDGFVKGTVERILAEALWEFGWVQADKRGNTSKSGGFPITMDRRWVQGDDLYKPLGKFDLKLSDFEVVI